MSTFKNFESDDIVVGRIQKVSSGVFPSGTPYWTNLHTSSIQTQLTGSNPYDVKSGLYYYNVYSDDPESSATAEALFSLTYGHISGRGSSAEDESTYKILPTRAIYNQYRNALLNPGDTKFTFQIGYGDNFETIDSDDIYVMNFNSNIYSDRLDPESFELTFSGSTGYLTVVTDYGVSTENTERAVYNIVEGTVGTATVAGTTSAPVGIGLFYPKLGVAVFNPSILSGILDSGTPDGSDYDTIYPGDFNEKYAINHEKLWNSIKAGTQNREMVARGTEFIPSRQYFIRVKNQEFNYSNNPTFTKSPEDAGYVASDEGKIRISEFYTDPKTYITTVGLYDDSNELVAVAKLSTPFQKSFDQEALIKIKINV
jgi:hypothetical protein